MAQIGVNMVLDKGMHTLLIFSLLFSTGLQEDPFTTHVGVHVTL